MSRNGSYPRSRLGSFPDEELMIRVKEQNDSEAFEELVKRYQLAALMYASHYGTSHAEDIVNESFLELWVTRDRYNNGSLFRAWFYLGLRTTCIDNFNKRNRWFRKWVPFAREADEAPIDPLDGSTGPEDIIDLIDFVKQILDRLDEEDRQGLVPHFFEDRTVNQTAEQIATRSGCTKQAAKRRFYRALERARRIAEQLLKPSCFSKRQLRRNSESMTGSGGTDSMSFMIKGEH